MFAWPLRPANGVAAKLKGTVLITVTNNDNIITMMIYTPLDMTIIT